MMAMDMDKRMAVRRAIRASGMTQAEVARHVGTTANNLSKVLRGAGGVGKDLEARLEHFVETHGCYRGERGARIDLGRDERALLRAYRRLPGSARDRILGYVLGLAASGGDEQAAELAGEVSEVLGALQGSETDRFGSDGQADGQAASA
jgi:transcriptional regulator with XRE-family HTH domain